MKEQTESGAIRTYDELVELVYNPPNDLMLSTQDWIQHAIHNFYANNYQEHRIVGYNSLIERTIENHDLMWLELIRLEDHDIQIYIDNDQYQDKVTVDCCLVENDGRPNYASDEDEVMIRADSFFYYTASHLTRVTKEIRDLQKSYGRQEISRASFIRQERGIAKQQLMDLAIQSRHEMNMQDEDPDETT